MTCRCGAELPPRSTGPGRPRKWCSTNCKKRAWENENDRRPCVECGDLLGAGAHRQGTVRCVSCQRNAEAAHRELVVQLRREGLKNVEIAARLGKTYYAVTHTLYREKKLDPSIPPSPHYRAVA